MVEIETILKGFREPEIIAEHVYEAWWSMDLKLGGPMSPRIRPLFMPIKMVGTAITVKTTPGYVGKCWLKAQEIADSGNVIVIDEEGDEMNSAWGGCISYGAKKKGVEGVVVDGGARDVADIIKLKFPVFCRAICLGHIHPKPWWSNSALYDQLNVPINCGGAIVRPGDIVVGAEGGVVVVPIEHAEEILKKAELLVKFDEKEKRYFDKGYSIRQIVEEELGGDVRKKYEWAAKP